MFHCEDILRAFVQASHLIVGFFFPFVAGTFTAFSRQGYGHRLFSERAILTTITYVSLHMYRMSILIMNEAVAHTLRPVTLKIRAYIVPIGYINSHTLSAAGIDTRIFACFSLRRVTIYVTFLAIVLLLVRRRPRLDSLKLARFYSACTAVRTELCSLSRDRINFHDGRDYSRRDATFDATFDALNRAGSFVEIG